jgi:hypothetical protein
MAGELEDPDFIPVKAPAADDDFVPVSPPVDPDMTPVRQHFEKNMGKVKEATGFMDYLEAGWDTSATGLVTGGKPDVVLPEDVPMYGQIASGIAQLAGDLPAIIPGTIAGFVGGGAAGTAVAPGPGTAVGAVLGAGAGGNAAPEAIRQILMDHYENGEFKNSRDFISRSMSIAWNTIKAGGIGAATAGVGGKVAKVVAPVLSKSTAPVAQTVAARLAQPAAEIATMTTMGAALEGELPDAEDFTVAGLMVATIHGVTKVAGSSSAVSKKMRSIYAKTGVKPEQVVEDAKADPILAQEILNDGTDLPSKYKELVVEKPAEPTVSMGDVLNEPTPEITPQHAAVRKVLETIGEKDAPKKKGYSFRKAYTDFVDRLDPINQAVKQLSENFKELPGHLNPYNLARMANDSKAKVKHTIEKGTLDYKTLAVNGKGLNDIVSPFRDSLDEFEAFLVSKRALDYEKRGLNAGVDMEAAREVIRMGEKKYGAAAKELVEFQRRNLQYLVDAGLLEEGAAKKMMRMGENYVPMKRLLEPEQFEVKRGKGGALRRVKGLEEGEMIETQRPLLSIMENTELFFKMAEKNRAVDAFVTMVEASGETGMIEKVKEKSKPINVSSEEVQRFFNEHGIDADPEAFNIFRPNRRQLGENEFEVFREGKREVYRTTDELAQAFKALDGDKHSSNILLKFARGLTTLKRIGITMTPEFITRNFLRDQMTTAATSKGGVIPFVDVVVAMGDLFKKNDVYYNWLKAGGAQGAFLELNDRYLLNDVFKQQKDTGLLDSAKNVIKTPFDAVLAAAHIVELAPRLAEFKRVAGKATSGGKIMEGGFASREVTLDFQRIGARMSAWNAITAFSNATIQGADKFARTIRDNPVGSTMKAAAYITTPSILLWWANKDDERVKAIPRWEKDLYWIIPTDSWVKATPEDHAELMPDYLKQTVNGELHINKGTIYRVPKPHEFGVLFGSLPERILDSLVQSDPRAFKGFDETMTKLLTPGFVPDAAAPVAEQWANKSLFTGRKMIPYHLEKVAPEFQYTDYTSEAAKQMSKLTAWFAGPEDAISPIVLDNYVRQWGGTIGQYAVQMADNYLLESGDKVKPEATLADIPAIKAFVVRYPNASASMITDFYDRLRAIEEKKETVRLLSKKEGMEDEIEGYLERTSATQMGMFSGTAKALSNARKEILAINANKSISPKEKRQLIDSRYYLMIEATRRAMEIADQLDRNLEQAEARVKR